MTIAILDDMNILVVAHNYSLFLSFLCFCFFTRPFESKGKNFVFVSVSQFI